MPHARAVLAVIDADASTLDCGGVGPGLPPGDAARFGLPDTYQIPTGTSTAARAAVTYAVAQLGKPYVWGGNGPNGFDCSGLMQQAWLRAGIRIGRTTYDQMLDGTPTTPRGLQPGDLVLIPGANGSLASPGHVGMYLGLGLVVHAPQTGDVVPVTTYEAFARAGISAHRHLG